MLRRLRLFGVGAVLLLLGLAASTTSESMGSAQPAASSLRWKFQTEGAIQSSPAIGGDGTVYVGSDDHYFYAIGPNGILQWKFQTGGKVESSPAIGPDDTISPAA